MIWLAQAKVAAIRPELRLFRKIWDMEDQKRISGPFPIALLMTFGWWCAKPCGAVCCSLSSPMERERLMTTGGGLHGFNV
jgi:hypothetical protein